jgi:hypothetical protein
MNPRQQFAISHPLTPEYPWALDDRFRAHVPCGDLILNTTMLIFGSCKGEPQQWFVCVLLWDVNCKPVELNSLAREHQDFVRRQAAELLDGVGSGATNVLDSHVGVLVFKEMSAEEIEQLPATARMRQRRAVEQC